VSHSFAEGNIIVFALKSKFFKSFALLISLALASTLLSATSPAAADYSPPVITTVHPSSGSITGGDMVTVTGANLQYVYGGRIGDNAIDFYHWVSVANDGSWLKFEAPNSAVKGLADLTLYSQINVTEPGVYTYTASSITSVTPNIGVAGGGTKISIKGVGFGPMEWGNGSISVKIGANYATQVVRVSPTEITAITPVGALGSADVVISFNNTQSLHFSDNVITGSKAFAYAPDNSAPVIKSLSPSKGPIAGGTQVTVTGLFLKDSSGNSGAFTFDGKAVTLVSMDANGTKAVVTAPAHAAGAVDVSVKTSNGSSTVVGAYTYSPPPTVTAITASSGVVEGGTKVTITGTNFGSVGAPVVLIGGKLALCTKLVSSTTITAVTRENPAGAADVEVTATTGAGSASKTGAFTYVDAASHPEIASITPNSGTTAGGTVIDIHSDATYPADTPNVMIGQLCALSVTRVDAHTIRATVPSATAGARNVSLTFANGYSVLLSGYTYVTPPPADITNVNPNSGFTAGGTVVNISGHGFGTTGNPLVKFGGVSATNIVRISDTLIIATTPANSLGAKTLEVTPGDALPISLANAFTYRGPVLTSVTPNNGPTTGGTAVTIVGDGFGASGTPVVTFGGKAATSIVRLNQTTITAVTPTGTAGAAEVAVTPEGGTIIKSSDLFTYKAARLTPLIYSSSPSTGPEVGGITLTVTGLNFKGTAGTTTTVKIGNVKPSNLAINSAGTSMTFTAPAFGPGTYDIWIQTDKGTAWSGLYTVLAPPSIPACSDATSSRILNPDGGTVVTIWGDRFGTTATAPTVKVGGVVTPVSSWGYSLQYFRYYVTFTDLGGSFGSQSVEVIPADNSGSSTLNTCLYRHAYASITADDKSKLFGAPTPVFTKTVVGERGTDKVTTVTYTFTGIGGVSYGPSLTPPTAAGVYQIRVSDASMSPGDINNYSFSYIDGTYTIYGLAATVTAIDTEKVYGDADPTFAVGIDGVAVGETHASGTITFSGNNYGPSTTPPTDAGTYTMTPSDEVLTSGNQDQYSFTYITGTYVIHKRPVSIVAVNQQKTYGDEDPSFPWEFADPTDTNMAYGETLLVGQLYRDEGENIGTYDLNLGNLNSQNPNYDITASLGYLSINPRHIDVTADDQSKIYGNGDPALTYYSSGLVGDDKLNGSLSRDAGEDVGNYTINQGTLDAPANYVIDSFTPGVLEIQKRQVNVGFWDDGKDYGVPDDWTDFGSGYGFYFTTNTHLAFNDQFTGAISRDPGENVGNYDIHPGTLALSDNYDLTFTLGGTFSIYPRWVTVHPVADQKVYGDSDPSAFSYTVGETTCCGGLINGDTLTGNLGRDEGENVGQYSFNAGTLDGGRNYRVYVAWWEGKFKITPRPITVTPDSQTKQYGDNDPEITFSVTSGALQNGDTLNGWIDRESGEAVGTYQFSDSNFWYYDPNYDVTVDQTNHFTITKKDITVVADNLSKQYGDGDPTFTFTTSPSSMPNGVSINLDGTLSRVDIGENVGNYDITQGTLDGGGNFNIVAFTPGNLEITKRHIDVGFYDDYKVYGQNDSDTDFGSGYGFYITNNTYPVNGDTFTGEIGRDPGESLGTYDINGGTLSLGANYDLTFSYGGVFEIDKRRVFIYPAHAEKVYGDDDPSAFGYTVNMTSCCDGLINGDTISGSLGRDSGESVGTYEFNIGTLDAGDNYYVMIPWWIRPEVFTITPKPITVTADHQTKIYGDNDPTATFTTTPSSLPFDDSLSGVLGRDGGEDVGSYSYNSGNLAASNSNYDISFVSNTLTINKLDITVAADDLQKQYGDADPGFTFTYSPVSLPNGTPIELSGSPERVAGEALGDYNITRGTLDGGDNFNVTGFTGAKLTIVPRTLHLLAGDKTAMFGAEIGSPSYTIVDGTTLVNGDTIASVGYDYSDVPYHVGSYDIIPGASLIFASGDKNNYDVQYLNGTLTITPAPMTIHLADALGNWGQAAPEFKASSVDGLVGQDAIGDMNFTFDASPTVPDYPGTYALDATLANMSTGDANDYDVTVIPASYQIGGPQWLQFTPPSGPEAGGTEFTIYGQGFGDKAPTITFDGLEATDVTLVDSGTITGFTPEHVQGPVDVQMIFNGTAYDLGTVFTYLPPVPTPSITVVYPEVAPTSGGNFVKIIGQNFCGSNGKPGQILVNGKIVAGAKVSKDCTTVTFKAPAYAAGNYTMQIKTKDGIAKYAPGLTYLGGGQKVISSVLIFWGDSPKLRAGAIAKLKAMVAKLKGKKNITVEIKGWVHKTRSSRIDAWLALQRAKNSAAFLKKYGIKGTFKIAAKGIYHAGNATDRRSEITIRYTD